jgi:hypothetical protein
MQRSVMDDAAVGLFSTFFYWFIAWLMEINSTRMTAFGCLSSSCGVGLRSAS